MFIYPVSEDEVVNIIKSCKPKHSKDCDDINMYVLSKVTDQIVKPLVHIFNTRRMPVQRAALCIRNFPSQYRTHFRGLSGHNAGRFNATVFISMLSGELAFPLIARQPLTRHC